MNGKKIFPFFAFALAAFLFVSLSGCDEFDCSEFSVRVDSGEITYQGGDVTLSVIGIDNSILGDVTLNFTCTAGDGTEHTATETGTRSHTFNLMPGQYNCTVIGTYQDKTCTKAVNFTVEASVGAECGNGYCEPGENSVTCPEDCTGPHGFTIKIEPLEQTVTLPEQFADLKPGDYEAEFSITFTNNTGRLVMVPTSHNYMNYVQEEEGNIGQVSFGVLERKAPNLCDMYYLDPTEEEAPNTIKIEFHVPNIGYHTSSKTYPFKFWIRYSENPFCSWQSGETCPWHLVESPTFYLHVNVSSGLEEEPVEYEKRPTEVQECEVQGLKGETLGGAIPHMLFSWDWEDIGTYECDQAGCHSGTSDAENVPGGERYCDATQFSISLFKKLETIERYIEGGGAVPRNLLQFRSYLTKDSFSDDFKEDFVDYYVNEFFGNTPDWFYHTDHWNRYFVDGSGKANESIEFRGDISKPGPYDVVISFQGYEEGETPDNFFFNQVEPNQKIIVNLSYNTKHAEPGPDSPLLEMPLDGFVGTTGSNPDRQGYGVVADEIVGTPFVFSRQGDEIVTIPSVAGDKEVGTHVTGILSSSPKVMTLTTSDVALSERVPVEIFAGIENHVQNFGAFYRILEESGFPYSPANATNFLNWSVLRASSDAEVDLACHGFNQESIGYDDAASSFSFSGESTCVAADKINAYGFWWSNPVKRKGKIVLGSLIYVPENPQYSLERVCDDSAFFAVGSSVLSEQEKKQLQNSAYSISSLKDVFDLVKEGKVCVVDGSEFYWNEDSILSTRHAQLAIDAEWGSGTFNSLEEC